jgi:hypothetical protein
MNDRDLVDAFVAHLSTHGHPGLQVGRRPDEDNRGTPDIDAVAGHFAIEHTSIDTIENQRRDSAWFMRAMGSLEQELGSRIPCRLNITIDYNAIAIGQDWEGIRANLQAWIEASVTELPRGRVEGVRGIPFGFHIVKSTSRRVRRPTVWGLRRFAPAVDSLAAELGRSADNPRTK